MRPKLIAFDMQEAVEGETPSVKALLEKLNAGTLTLEEIREAGVPVAKGYLRRDLGVEEGRGKIKEILAAYCEKEAPLGAIEIPEMITLSHKLSIMKGEVTVGLFKQVMQGYEITGNEAGKLQAILADPSKAGEALTYVSLLDAREFAKRLSEQTGRKFRVQTEAEWLQAKDRLSGANWTWTETEHEDYPGQFVLRHLSVGGRGNSHPGSCYGFAVRLVEDK